MGIDQGESGPKISEKTKRRYRPGDVVGSAYRPPSRPREGFRWKPVGWHLGEKKYPTRWRLEEIKSEPPTFDELPPLEPGTGEEIKINQPLLIEEPKKD